MDADFKSRISGLTVETGFKIVQPCASEPVAKDGLRGTSHEQKNDRLFALFLVGYACREHRTNGGQKEHGR